MSQDLEKPTCAEIAELRFQGLMWKEIGERLSLSAEAVRSRYRRWVKAGNRLAPEQRVEFCGVRAQMIVQALRKKPHTLRELSLVVDRSEATVEQIIAEMVAAGYGVERGERRVTLPTKPAVPFESPPLFPMGDEVDICFGIVSDTHGASYAEQVTALHDFVNVAYGEYGVRHILHGGDAFAGWGVYRGQQAEVYATSGEEQAEVVANNLPSKEGLRWYLLGGNHDYSFHRLAGLDVRRELGRRGRDDVTLLAYDEADVPLLPGVEARLWHPSGGIPYALCLSDDTEILTRRGWVGVDTICMSDGVATLNRETGELEYQMPLELFIEKYTGIMFHFSSRTVDHLVTPQHELWIRPYNESRGDGEWRKVPAADLADARRQEWQMSMVAEWNGTEIETFRVPFRKWPGAHDLGDMPADEFLTFLGWYISEGHIQQDKIVCVTNTDEDEVAAIRSCMEAIGLHVRVYEEERPGYKTVYRVRAHNANLCRWLKRKCGDRARCKQVPRFVMDLSSRQIGIFLDALFAGDGTKNDGRRWFVYNSVSEHLRDDVQELLLKVGAAGTVGRRTVGVLEQNMPTINRPPSAVDYDGLIWCVRVPNGIIYARRNGKAIWTGNSYRGQKGAEQIAQDELMQVVMGEKPKPTIRLVVVGHLHVMYLFDHGPMVVVGAGCFEGRNSYLKRKGLVPHIGGWIMRCRFVDGMLHRIEAVRIRYREMEDDWRAWWVKRQARGREVEVLEPIFSLEAGIASSLRSSQ